MERKKLEKIAWAPYEDIPDPTREDWRKAYDALTELAERYPKDGRYPNTLGYLCYYGRHTGERDYEEARKWFEKGAELRMIESTYKLADMLTDGLGGPADGERAVYLYLHMYLYCKNEFEGGRKDSKFADTALRMGRMFHEGKLTRRLDLDALAYLLEAKYAIDWRKQYGAYGDETVERNILRLIDECEKPDEESRNREQYGIRLCCVPERLIPLGGGVRMAMDVEADPYGVLRLTCRRQRKAVHQGEPQADHDEEPQEDPDHRNGRTQERQAQGQEGDKQVEDRPAEVVQHYRHGPVLQVRRNHQALSAGSGDAQPP